MKHFEARLLQWLDDRVNEGRGAIEFGLTENGNIGVFRAGEKTVWESGLTVVEALANAAKKYPNGKPYEVASA